MKNTIFNAAYQAPRLGYVEHTYERHDACGDDIRHTEWQQQHSDDGSRQLPDDEVQVDVANPVGVHLGNEASFSHSACVLPPSTALPLAAYSNKLSAHSLMTEKVRCPLQGLEDLLKTIQAGLRCDGVTT